MSIQLQTGLYVRIEECALESGLREQGFSRDRLYRVLDAQNASASFESIVMLTNDRDELCFVLNRHVRVALIAPERFEVRLPRDPFEDWVEVPTEEQIHSLSPDPIRRVQPWSSNAAD